MVKTGLRVTAVHRESKGSVGLKASQEGMDRQVPPAIMAALGGMESMAWTAKTELLETGARKDRRVLLVPVGSPDRKVTMASV